MRKMEHAEKRGLPGLRLRMMRLPVLLLSALSAGVLLTGWYHQCLGKAFAEQYHYTAADALLTLWGKYPEQQPAFAPDHLLITAVPFLLTGCWWMSFISGCSVQMRFYTVWRQKDPAGQVRSDWNGILQNCILWMGMFWLTIASGSGILYGVQGRSWFLGEDTDFLMTAGLCARWGLRQVGTELLCAFPAYYLMPGKGEAAAAVTYCILTVALRTLEFNGYCLSPYAILVFLVPELAFLYLTKRSGKLYLYVIRQQ